MNEFIVAGIIAAAFWLNGVLCGAAGLLVYMIERMMKDAGMDDSNRTNAMRLLVHVVMHPFDFYYMYYIDAVTSKTRKPFWYLTHDEISEVVQSRPKQFELDFARSDQR